MSSAPGPHHHHHHHTTLSTSPPLPTTTKVQTGCTHLWVIFSAGAAAKRRERRLSSWLRRERTTVAMALAEQLHHSVNRVERDEALRRQTTRASVEEEVHELNVGPRAKKRPPPRCGRVAYRSPRRRGATAACGAPQGKLLSWLCQRWRMLRLKPSMVAPSASSSRRPRKRGRKWWRSSRRRSTR